MSVKMMIILMLVITGLHVVPIIRLMAAIEIFVRIKKPSKPVEYTEIVLRLHRVLNADS